MRNKDKCTDAYLEIEDRRRRRVFKEFMSRVVLDENRRKEPKVKPTELRIVLVGKVIRFRRNF